MNTNIITTCMMVVIFLWPSYAKGIKQMAKRKEPNSQMLFEFSEGESSSSPAQVRMDVRDRTTLSQTEEELLRLSELENFSPVEVWTALGTNKQLAYSTHGLFRYFGKFPPPVATYLMNVYTKPDDLVFDPMCGSGTTGVEALLNRRKCILNDISPLSVLLAHVKTTALDEKVLTNTLNKIIRSYKPLTIKEYAFEPTALRNHEHWFLPETENSLRGIKKLVEEIDDENVKQFFRVCFLSIIRRVSRATTQQGRLFLDAETAEPDALPFFKKKSVENIKAVASLPKSLEYQPEVYAVDLRDGIPTNVIGRASLVICHPPYFNSYKYSSINSLELAWMGEEFSQLRKSEVREFFKVGKEENVDVYVSDMVSVLRNLKPSLKPGATLALMIGDTMIHGNYIPCTKLILEKVRDDFCVQKVVMRAPKYTEASWAASQRRNGGQVGITLYDFIILLKPIFENTQNNNIESSTREDEHDMGTLKAKTHTAEYQLHKYWARKPHNIVRDMISRYSPTNGIVIDPCCGSGVAVYEAKKLGRTAYGFDVNPVACNISSVLVSPPDRSKFMTCITNILKRIQLEVGSIYSWNGKTIRYCIHDIVVQCENCGKRVSFSEAGNKGKTKVCPGCAQKLRFNLENLKSTKITGVVFEGESEICRNDHVLEAQMKASSMVFHRDLFERFDMPFDENRRILAFAGMTTRNLFTDRNFSLICLLASEIANIEDEKIRVCAQVFLTASVAQCSRLIASRNNLKTGGPAWSIPGFWVPATHLETNPICHFKARLKRFEKGLAVLEKANNNTIATIEKCDGAVGMNRLYQKGIRADMIFFDPPYGDSIPYMEFSAMWNSFLGQKPDTKKDISVSDRMKKDDSWALYAAGLNKIVSSAYHVLADNGKIVVTFNNNDIRAWKILLTSFQSNGFRCSRASFQEPAVISSKAQKAIEGSYVSDFYCVFEKSKKKCAGIDDVMNWAAANHQEATQRESETRRNLLTYWLNANVDASLLDQFDTVVRSISER